MLLKAITAASLMLLSGCQLHSSNPTGSITLAGDYRALSDCFLLAVRGEGFWRKDDLPSLNTSQVIMGNAQFSAGRVDFSGNPDGTTTVTMLIPHPDKFEPKVRACAS